MTNICVLIQSSLYFSGSFTTDPQWYFTNSSSLTKAWQIGRKIIRFCCRIFCKGSENASKTLGYKRLEILNGKESNQECSSVLKV